jgi:hypothetical protein
MKRKKPTPDDERARRDAQRARIRALYERAEQIRVELEASRAKREHE